MASGKSTIGHSLAKKLSFNFIDTDDLVERKVGMRIKDIFAKNGEAAFREYETTTAKELAKLALDLGKIGNIGEVVVNGKNCGTIWMKGQICDITGDVVKGINLLTIHVTNTNINRVSSFKELVPVPDEIKSRFGNVKSDTKKPREFGFEPLPPSGLMGPVRIIPVRTLIIEK